MQHLPKDLASLIPQVQSLSELRSARSVDGANVLDVCVYPGTERRPLGKGGDAAWGGDLEKAKNVYEEEFAAYGEAHGGGGDGEEADGRIAGACSTEELLVGVLGKQNHGDRRKLTQSARS